MFFPLTVGITADGENYTEDIQINNREENSTPASNNGDGDENESMQVPLDNKEELSDGNYFPFLKGDLKFIPLQF